MQCVPFQIAEALLEKEALTYKDMEQLIGPSPFANKRAMSVDWDVAGTPATWSGNWWSQLQTADANSACCYSTVKHNVLLSDACFGSWLCRPGWERSSFKIALEHIAAPVWISPAFDHSSKWQSVLSWYPRCREFLMGQIMMRLKGKLCTVYLNNKHYFAGVCNTKLTYHVV